MATELPLLRRERTWIMSVQNTPGTTPATGSGPT